MFSINLFVAAPELSFNLKIVIYLKQTILLFIKIIWKKKNMKIWISYYVRAFWVFFLNSKWNFSLHRHQNIVLMSMFYVFSI